MDYSQAISFIYILFYYQILLFLGGGFAAYLLMVHASSLESIPQT